LATSTNENSKSQANLKQIWQATLSQLQVQMTRATFETQLQDTHLISAENGLFTIATKSPLAKDWLENRLYTIIQHTLANIVDDRTIGLEFTVAQVEAGSSSVNGFEAKPLSEILAPGDLILDTQPTDPSANFAQEVDFEHLWQKTGFTQVPDYALRYWRIYLGRAFDLWEFLISEDKRNVKQMQKGEIPYWTSPRRYSYRSLASILGCGRKTLTGRLVPCGVYEKKKMLAIENAEPPPAPVCCGKQILHKMQTKTQHETECVYWLEGILERLYREGLIAVKRVRAPGKPRSHDLRLQAWRLLPVLTPAQVDRFKREVDQVRHQNWIEQYGHLAGFDLATWERITVELLATHLPGYEWGRELFDVYQNNPLLEMSVDESQVTSIILGSCAPNT
jgi:hypothetical protein